MPHFQYSLNGKVQYFPIVRNLTAVGSSPECDLVIVAEGVAPTHCMLMHEPGRYRLESAQRSTPFYVRGKRTRAYDVKHGDAISIGSIELVFSAVDVPQQDTTDDEGAQTN